MSFPPSVFTPSGDAWADRATVSVIAAISNAPTCVIECFDSEPEFALPYSAAILLSMCNNKKDASLVPQCIAAGLSYPVRGKEVNGCVVSNPNYMSDLAESLAVMSTVDAACVDLTGHYPPTDFGAVCEVLDASKPKWCYSTKSCERKCKK
ncbi:hypothetical protein HDU98_009464 [Podochytrium sp. JEL0797]|nr:hypothetical protein HDU98_009464 [Podochytrium sp. JEL0797]